jgi:predicted enzyme related to lactoylglutathione lyase
MAISSAICNTFKRDLLKGFHDFDSSGGDTFKIALYTSSASLGASTTDYSTTNEITNTSGSAYTAGGETLTNNGVTGGSGASTAYVDFADAQWTSASFTANGALIYNTTTDGGSGTTDAVCVLAFGGDFTASNGTFTVQFPAANTSDAIIRIS